MSQCHQAVQQSDPVVCLVITILKILINIEVAAAVYYFRGE